MDSCLLKTNALPSLILGIQKGVQPVVQVGLRPLFSGKAPVSTPPTPPVTAALEEEKPSASTKSVAPIKAKETKIPVSVKSKEAKAAGKTQAASVAAAAAAASSSVSSSPSNQSTPEVVMAEASPKKETKKRNLKRPAEEAVSTPAALANEVENSTATTTSSTAAAEELKESPPKRVKLSQVADSLAQLKPQAVAIATKINTEKNARPLKIKATAAEIKELKLRALEAKRSGKMDEVVEVEKPVIEKPQVKKRGIVLKLENNTVKTYDRRLPIGMIPIELPPFSPSRSALKVTK
ncbi:hypothetical protein BDR26DRAFT_575718 [Obelidium mucronatum]|nr:hypothetical protein BDR26DRAFT_575718 [Obelidium mucronatum]